jgi:hypothetical protein
MFYPGFKGSKLMMTATLTGTTFTGHPTSTTYGNTLRMFFYTQYIMSHMTFKTKPVQMHAGDDVALALEESDCNQLREEVRKLTLEDIPKERTEYGIG